MSHMVPPPCPRIHHCLGRAAQISVPLLPPYPRSVPLKMRGSCCVAVVLATAVVLLVDAASLPHVDYVRKFNTDGPLPLLQPEGSDLPEQIKLSYIGDDSLKLSFLGPKSVDDAQAPLTEALLCRLIVPSFVQVAFGISADKLTSKGSVLEEPTRYSCSEVTCVCDPWSRFTK